ncbi:MAG: hypothetical protein SXA11_24150 [Cyanobacteriota bacterium]|nr:hypothetical protein [Cyanobacteriota bacterium]
MQSLKLQSRVDAEGILHLQLPPELANRELELIVVYQSIELANQRKTAEELGYPPDFLEKTAGGWQGEMLTRGDRGTCDERQWDLL